MPIRFTQPCPTCGRRIQVQASLMGHSVACPHCRAEFSADGVEAGGQVGSKHPEGHQSVDPLMIRVEKALARASAEQPVVG